MTMARTLRVLVVDDQMSMRALVRTFLRKLGFESIDEADSGKNAFIELGKRPYNLVISDYNMENGTGLELLVNMRKHPVLKRVPVIMVTGNSDSGSVQAVVQAGVSGYVVKPVSQDALAARIVKIFGPLQ